MNDDAIPATKRPSLWPVFRDYAIAVAKYWYAIVVGIILSWIDFAERSLGTWWIFRPWVRLVTVTLGFAVAQFLAYRDLYLAHANEKARDATKHAAEITELQRKVEALTVRPYDRAQVELVAGKLRGLDETTLELLRFLLQNGPIERGPMERQFQWPQNVLDGALTILRDRLLIEREERLNVGRASVTLFWRVYPNFEQVLRDELFGPR